MPFDQSSILDLTLTPLDADLLVSWQSSAPSGTWFHLYLNGDMVWSGIKTQAVIPLPVTTSRIEVGTVLPSEAQTDQSVGLPVVPGGGSRITLTWQGGTFLSPDIEGFHVYLGDTPGASVDYSHILGTVTAYPAGIILDGFGLGGFGQGGFGLAASTYEWVSNPVLSGTWNVAVKAFDSAGNEGSAYAWSVVVAGPPQPPARNASGFRLTYQSFRSSPGGFGTGGFGEGGFGDGTPLGFGQGGFGLGGFGVGQGVGTTYAVLNWLASPGS